MRKIVGMVVTFGVILNLSSYGFAQENVSNEDKEKREKVEQSDSKDTKIRFGIGFNQTLFSAYSSPDIGVTGVRKSDYYTKNNKKELELRVVSKSTGINPSTGLSSGGNAYHVISWQEFDISDKGNFPSATDVANLSTEGRKILVDNWVAYGRGMALRYSYLDEVRKAKFLRIYVGPEVGIFFRHEALRFKEGQDGDNYRRGLSFGLRGGLNFLVTKNFLFYVEHGGRFNFVVDVEIANFKTGIVYIF